MKPKTPLGRTLRSRVKANRQRSLTWAALSLVVLSVLAGLFLVAGPGLFSDKVQAGRSGQETEPVVPIDAPGRREHSGRSPGQRSSFTVSTSGDILIHSPVWDDALGYGGGGAYDFSPMFRPIRRYIKGVDVAICHVETPITTGPPSGYPIFSAPADLAVGIRKAGWQACDTASNHSLDQGQAGIDQTAALLAKQGIRHTGSARSRKASKHPVVLDAGPAKVGLVAYTDATNGIPSPHPWSVNLLPAADPVAAKAARIARDVRRTIKAGADLVIVNLQWGDENSAHPNRSQRRLARRVVAIDGVAAIAGQGPHVVQPIERIEGKFVIFSAGNLLSNQSPLAGLPAATQDGLIALLRFSGTAGKFRVRRIDYVPVMVEMEGHEVLPTGRGSRTHPEAAGALAESWQRTVDVAGRSRKVRPVPRNRP